MTTRRQVLGGLTGAALGLALPSARRATAAVSTSLPALFFAPHQDDETLSMGVEIVRHVSAGRPVTVVGVGDGTASAALGVLNGAVTCAAHGYRHEPPGGAMSAADMGAARTIEQASACAALGVSEYVPGTRPEGNLTVETWRDVLLEHEHRVAAGGAVYVPMPWETTGGVGNPDHGNGGLAMRQLLADGHFATATVRYSVFSRYWAVSGCPAGTTRGPATAEERARLLAAADAYRAWSPAAGAYAVGWSHSVAADFQAGFEEAGPRYLLQRHHA